MRAAAFQHDRQQVLPNRPRAALAEAVDPQPAVAVLRRRLYPHAVDVEPHLATDAEAERGSLRARTIPEGVDVHDLGH